MAPSPDLVKKLTHFRIWMIIRGLCYILTVVYFVNIYYVQCAVSCDLKTEAANFGGMPMMLEIGTPIACLVYGLIGAHVLYLAFRTTPSIPPPPKHFKGFKADNVGTLVVFGIVILMFIGTADKNTPLQQPYWLSIAIMGLVSMFAGIPGEIIAKGYRKVAATQEAAAKLEAAKLEAAERAADKQVIEQMKRRVEEETKTGAFVSTLDQEFNKWGQGTEKAANAGGGKVDAPVSSVPAVPSMPTGERIEKARKLVRMSAEVTIPDLASVLQVARALLLDKLLEGDGAPGVRVNGDHIVIENNDAFAEFLARVFTRKSISFAKSVASVKSSLIIYPFS